MENITAKLRHRVDVYYTIPAMSKLGEHTRRPKYLKRAYCEIVPLRSKEKAGEANTESNKHAFRFLFRAMSIKGIEKDWFFIFDGQKYTVDYFNKDFKDSTFIEVFCTRLEE